MSLFEIILIGAGLSMDAFAVTVSNTMSFKDLNKGITISMPVLFGLFQGIMPLAGFHLGYLFHETLERYQGIVAFIILAVIGGKMIYDVIRGREEDVKDSMSIGTVLLQALATSIDAFAVGVGFAGTGVNIYTASSVIAVTTFLLICAAVPAGRRLGTALGDKAKIAGGAILICIGIKSLIGI